MHGHRKSHHKISPITGLKEGSKVDMKLDAKIAKRLPETVSASMPPKAEKHLHKMAHHMHKMMDHLHKHTAHHKLAKLGSGKRFAALKGKLAKKGATNPGALAAYIGRKKFGAKKMAKMSAAGRKRHAKK